MSAPIGASGDDVTSPPFVIADRIAQRVGGPVIVEDASFRVIGYSAFTGPMDRGRTEAILGRRIPAAWLTHLERTGGVTRLRTTEDVVDVAEGPWAARRRLITAFRAGGRVLGIAWVAEGDVALGPEAPRQLRAAVDENTPDLLAHLERLDAEEAHRTRLAAALLDGLPGATAAADRLGFDRDGRFVVLSLTVAPPPGDPPLHELSVGARLAEHLRLCLDSFRRRGAVTPRGDAACLAVVQLRPGEGEDSVALLGHEVVRLAGTGPLRELTVVASTLAAGVAQLPVLREEATEGSLVASAPGTFVPFADVEADVVVARVVAALPDGLRLSGLDRLRLADRDGAAAGEMERTLRAFLGCCGNVTDTARELGVHATTVRHRLERVTRLSGLRLDRPEVRVACELVLRRG